MNHKMCARVVTRVGVVHARPSNPGLYCTTRDAMRASSFPVHRTSGPAGNIGPTARG